MHYRQLARVVELEAWDSPATGKDRGLGQLTQLAAVDKGFEDVLLDVVLMVGGKSANEAKSKVL